MKASTVLTLILLVGNFAGASDCKDLPSKLSEIKTAIETHNGLIRTNYSSRVRFTRQLYSELTANEGRELYIPYGTYDSVKRSISKEENNLDYVVETTSKNESDLAEFAEQLKQCL